MGKDMEKYERDIRFIVILTTISLLFYVGGLFVTWKFNPAAWGFATRLVVFSTTIILTLFFFGITDPDGD